MATRMVAAAALAAALGAAGGARGDWLQPDPTLREAQMLARMAARDTAGHGNDPARLDSLGRQLMRLARLDEAERVYARARAADPRDVEAAAALGKIALFRGRLEDAERLLVAAGDEEGAREDLLALHRRRGDYARAAELADGLGQQGDAVLLRAMAEAPVYQITAGPEMVRLQWKRAYPTPLVRVKLNGLSVLMAIDTGACDLLIDPAAMRRARVTQLPAQRTVLWTGSRMAVSNAMVQRLELGAFKLERVPAGILPLRKWSLEVNPLSEPVVGVLGIELLRRFTPTLDWKNHVLELRRPNAASAAAAGASRVPFEMWGACELTVYGSIAGGRRLSMIVQSGIPGCGIAAPADVFEEAGIKPGLMSRAVKSAGRWLQGRSWTSVSVPAVTVGPIAQDRVQGWSGALDPTELWRHGVRRDALLGGDFFRGRRVTIDWEARALVVE